MTNHVHLLVTPNVKHGLSRMMQRVGARYVRYINHTYQRTGTLWEGRYKSGLVGTDRYLLVCYRYIELNPVRAAMVAAPENYPHSSYRTNALGMATSLLTPHPVYTGLGGTPEARCQAYRALFRDALAGEDVNAIRLSVNKEMIYGNDRFKTHVAAMTRRPVRPGKAGRPRLAEDT
jgi:putative transposase